MYTHTHIKSQRGTDPLYIMISALFIPYALFIPHRIDLRQKRKISWQLSCEMLKNGVLFICPQSLQIKRAFPLAEQITLFILALICLCVWRLLCRSFICTVWILECWNKCVE